MPDYSDLPEWVRPGQTAYIGGWSDQQKVTISRVTPARIVVLTKYGAEHQCDRMPLKHESCHRAGCSHDAYHVRMAGHYNMQLRPPHCLAVLDNVVADTRKNAVSQVLNGADWDWNRGEFAERRKVRSQNPDELVLEWLDHVENRVRQQRAKLLAAIEQRNERKRELES